MDRIESDTLTPLRAGPQGLATTFSPCRKTMGMHRPSGHDGCSTERLLKVQQALGRLISMRRARAQSREKHHM